MLDRAVINRIRAIFLHHEPRVTIAAAAGLLGWSRAKMSRAVRNGEIEVVETCSGKSIELRELAAFALQQWPLTVIERALGREAALILPPALPTGARRSAAAVSARGVAGAGRGRRRVGGGDADADGRGA
jgi:hypothetical protein